MRHTNEAVIGISYNSKRIEIFDVVVAILFIVFSKGIVAMLNVLVVFPGIK
jgi:hypothetical protein